MWNELNRMLGVNRKDELAERAGVQNAAATPGLGKEPGNGPGTATPIAASQSPSEREQHEPAGRIEPESTAPVASDGAGGPSADDAEWARILADEPRCADDPVAGGPDEWDQELPHSDDSPGDDSPGDDSPGDDSPGDDSPGDDNSGDDNSGDDRPVPESSAAPRPFGVSRPPAPRGKLSGRRLVKPAPSSGESTKGQSPTHTPEQRLLILDCWQRSGLPAQDFADLVGVSKHTLYAWKKAFTQHGPAGLMGQPRGAKPGSRLPEVTQRSILMLKQAHPDWGCERISVMLARGPALGASPGAVSRVLHEAGYELEESPTRPHPDKVRSFERAVPNQLWQTDLFTFVLKRQNRRVYLVAFMDDHSRFLVSFGLHASQSTALVLEVLRAGITSYGAPREVLTDNGAQYVTWRGKSQFTKELEKRGIQQVVAKPRHPQTLGKIERFWGTLWRECLEAAVFIDLADARARIGHFIDWYNFRRPHSGIDCLAPADRFFGAAPDVLRTLREQVAANALELARNGVPRPPFYVTGQVGGQNFSLHAEGERMFLTREGEQRREVDLVSPPQVTPENGMPPPVCPDGSPAVDESSTGTEGSEPLPGVSPLDDFLKLPPEARGPVSGVGDAPLRAPDIATGPESPTEPSTPASARGNTTNSGTTHDTANGGAS